MKRWFHTFKRRQEKPLASTVPFNSYSELPQCSLFESKQEILEIESGMIISSASQFYLTWSRLADLLIVTAHRLELFRVRELILIIFSNLNQQSPKLKFYTSWFYFAGM